MDLAGGHIQMTGIILRKAVTKVTFHLQESVLTFSKALAYPEIAWQIWDDLLLLVAHMTKARAQIQRINQKHGNMIQR
jgi:hypothetical protein